MKKLILLLPCFFAVILFAQSPTLLKGTIGSYPIVMDLDNFGDTVTSARYFYESKRKDIELEGQLHKDGSITLVCYNNYDEKFDKKSERFVLRKTHNGYIGTWSTMQKTLPVSLHFISVDSIKNRFVGHASIQKMKGETPIDYARVAGLQFIKDSVTKRKDYYLEWYHEKYSGVYLFRLRKEVMTDAIRKINEQLEEAQLAEANNSLTCTSPRTETEFDQSIDHIFLNGEVLSINISTGYDCGGAHPDFGSSALNFDLISGDALKLDDVLWFGGTKTFKEDSDEWYTYRDSVFAPKLVALLKQIYPRQMKPSGDEEGCNYADPEVWDFPNWYFTSKGLYLGAYFARVARSCDEPEWSILPYRIVKKYVKPGLKIKLPD